MLDFQGFCAITKQKTLAGTFSAAAACPPVFYFKEYIDTTGATVQIVALCGIRITLIMHINLSNYPP
jgi:hypothetical protein